MAISSKKGSFYNASAGLAGIVLATLGLLLFGTPRSHLIPLGTRLDLGNVGVGQNSVKAFPIYNHSSTPIVIAGWAPTCHCVQAIFPQTIVPPGKSIYAYVKTTATTPLGKRVVVLAIQWHFVGDSLVRTDNLIVSAKYVSPLSLSEERLDFGTVPLSDIRIKTLYIRPGNGADNWNSLIVTPASDRLSARIQPTSTGFQVQAQINPQGLPAGIWKSSLKFFTLQNGSRTGEEVDVPIVARIQGPYSIYPPFLEFLKYPHCPLTFTLRVHSSTVPIRKLRFLGSIVQKSNIKIIGDGKDAIVTGSLARPASNELFVGKISLQINDSPDGSLQLSLIGYPS